MGETHPVDEDAVEALREQLRGSLLRPGETGYDEARTIWNAMIDREPAVIARCEGTADVISAVNYAREHDRLLAVKGGGHNVAGNAVCDDGLMIDLEPMDTVRVDPDSKTARVRPGATLSDFDHEAQAFGLATPLGINSTTGIAGLTLGGGFGWLSRKYGLTVDNLRSVDLVTANGELIHASEDENEELFWGLRGGGGNFGVVTSFEFDLHEVGPELLCGPVVFDIEEAHTVLRNWRDYIQDIPDELTVWVDMFTAPEFPFLNEAYYGEPVVGVVGFYTGDVEDGEQYAEDVRAFGTPVGDAFIPHQYAGFQSALDDFGPPGDRNYWKSHNVAEFTDDALDTAIEYAKNMPTPYGEILLVHLGGAVSRVPADATAYPHRNTEFLTNIHSRWKDPSMDEEGIAWARDYFEAMTPHATGGTYVNFISESEGEESMAYRDHYNRLVQLKNEWDPENLFRMNQNIEPTG